MNRDQTDRERDYDSENEPNDEHLERGEAETEYSGSDGESQRTGSKSAGRATGRTASKRAGQRTGKARAKRGTPRTSRTPR